MKEASSFEVPQKKGPVHTYSDSLEKPRSESIATHQRKCLRALQTRATWETRIVGKVYNLCRVKTNRLAVLMVTSGLDPHMIIELEVDLNRCSNLWLIVVYLYIYAYLVGLMVYTYS